jgi:hypothetical protein
MHFPAFSNFICICLKPTEEKLRFVNTAFPRQEGNYVHTFLSLLESASRKNKGGTDERRK